MSSYAEEAKTIASSLEAGAARDSLIQLIDFVVDRRR
jgi:hypothetical protein